mmetsp:Transcript_6129/g.13578  ORF Transcript_6129/g.13578 Transcript_6129/m.13578 type:complete len:93 (+) Transcript_6129:98-376(+)
MQAAIRRELRKVTGNIGGGDGGASRSLAPSTRPAFFSSAFATLATLVHRINDLVPLPPPPPSLRTPEPLHNTFPRHLHPPPRQCTHHDLQSR